MATILQVHGSHAVLRGDYLRMLRLHQQSWDKLAMDHVELVYSLYKMVASGEDEQGGLLNEGLKALSKAIDTYDPARGIHFINYASSLISRAFYRHLRRDSRPCYREHSGIDGLACSIRSDRQA